MNDPMTHGITGELLDDVFPFYIGCDRELRISSAGRSMRKLFGAIYGDASDSWLGRALSSVMQLRRPNVVASFDSFASRKDELFELKLTEADVSLFGQVHCTSDSVLLLSSMRFERPEQMIALGLDVSDYAIHDCALETVFMRQSQVTQLAELQRMVSQLEQALQDKEQCQAAEDALLHDLNAACDFCVRFDSEGRIIDIQSAREAYLPCEPQHMVGRTLRDTLPGVAEITAPILKFFPNLTAPIPVEFQLHTSVVDFWFEARVAPTLASNYLLVARDVTDRRELEKRLEFRALHDPLTNLANRTLFQQNVLDAQKVSSDNAILLVDVDDFKSYNDNYGHHVGDLVLRQLADRIRQVCRASDTPSRLGGDEFGVFVTEIRQPEYAEQFARRLVEEMERPIEADGITIEPRVSVGVAFDGGGQEVEEMLRDADFAMYYSKQCVDKSIVVCDDEVRQKLKDRNAIKSGMLNAIRNKEFVPFYQPIIDLRSRQICGFEALVRWDHPERGILSPFFFLEIAEENGLIIDIGKSMLMDACCDAQELRSLFPKMPIRMSVNLASRQVQDAGLLDTVDEALQATGLPSDLLTLEITESALIDDFEQAKQTFIQIRERGIRVALDDFGVGYSSLNYLQSFPIDSLKLDRSLITDICESKNQLRITECVVALGHTLGLEVVAEGIEENDQLRSIEQLGCDYGQGFLFAKPQPLDRAAELLAHQHAGHDIVDWADVAGKRSFAAAESI